MSQIGATSLPLRCASDVWLEDWVVGNVLSSRPNVASPAPTPEFLGSFKSMNFTVVSNSRPKILGRPVSRCV